MIYNIEKICKEYQKGKKLKYIFFWGHQPKKNGSLSKSCLSQWWIQEFTHKNIIYFCAEQWMMAEKARLFKDNDCLNKILKSKTPKECKMLGRKIQNFDEEIWNKNKCNIVLFGNFLKFSQNKLLMDYLLNTKNKILVEVSPYDKIWGIGMKENNVHINNPNKWKGKNLLGFALMEVRENLKGNIKLQRIDFL